MAAASVELVYRRKRPIPLVRRKMTPRDNRLEHYLFLLVHFTSSARAWRSDHCLCTQCSNNTRVYHCLLRYALFHLNFKELLLFSEPKKNFFSVYLSYNNAKFSKRSFLRSITILV